MKSCLAIRAVDERELPQLATKPGVAFRNTAAGRSFDQMMKCCRLA